MTNRTNNGPFVIVGGGIGGASAALALALRGIESIVLERSEYFRELGAGIQMPPNAFRVFDHLGVADACRSAASFPKNWILMDSLTGEEVISLPVGSKEFEERFGFPYAVMHRGDLLEILLEACRKTGLVTLRTNARVTEVHDDGDGVVVATDNGEKFEGVGVVGADGLWSMTRQLIVGDGQPNTEGDVIYRGVIPFDAVPSELYQESVVMWGGPFMDFAHYPLRRGELYNMAGIFRVPVPADGSTPVGTPEQFHDAFSDACESVKELLPQLDMDKSWVLYDRPPTKKWFEGRVALLGDAAHPSYHYIAQGACMALEDSAVLADALSSSTDVTAGFREYRDRRYLRTARVQLTARQFGELYHADGVYRDLRKAVVGSMDSSAVFDKLAWIFDGIELDRAS